jgi:hypothetical protein
MKITNLLLIGLLLIGFSGCKKNSDSETPSPNIENTPSAVAANNNSSAGVYKGVMVGSSGYFKISIQNGDNSTSCLFVLDGKEVTLTTTSLGNWTPGQAITNAVFTGSWNGVSVSLTFSCGADGSNPTASVTVPGHSVNVSMSKETSTTLVKCYEGTYVDHRQTGNVNGTWNFVIYGNIGVGYHYDSQNSGAIAGTVSGNTLTMDIGTLTITDTSVSGTLNNGDNDITVTGHRSM